MARQRQDVLDRLAEAMREARLRKRLTQPEAADLVGASLRQYGRWEQGASWPNLDYLAKIEEALEIDADRLVVSEPAADDRFAELEDRVDQVLDLVEWLVRDRLNAADEPVPASPSTLRAEARGPEARDR